MVIKQIRNFFFDHEVLLILIIYRKNFGEDIFLFIKMECN